MNTCRGGWGKIAMRQQETCHLLVSDFSLNLGA